MPKMLLEICIGLGDAASDWLVLMLVLPAQSCRAFSLSSTPLLISGNSKYNRGLCCSLHCRHHHNSLNMSPLKGDKKRGSYHTFSMDLQSSSRPPVIGVVIPCYKVSRHIESVLSSIGDEVEIIVVVDDACPEATGRLVEQRCKDPRVSVEFLPNNRGVGGAVLAGYRKAVELGATVIVKLDGDGQMDPSLIGQFVSPIISGVADYTKGNRFFNLESLRSMPTLRLVGNAMLSFVSKLSSGYWKVMDPTNGYTAIDARVAAILPYEKIASRYFFESDMLFRLNTLQAVIRDIPMDAVYGNEQSNLRIRKVLFEFPVQHAIRFFKRIFYNYFLRDFNAASLHLVVGMLLSVSGITYGLAKWMHYSALNVAAPSGTVLLATIQVILGVQFLLAWTTYDVNCNPAEPVSPKLRPTTSLKAAGSLKAAESPMRIRNIDAVPKAGNM